MDPYLLETLQEAGFTVLDIGTNDEPSLVISIRCARTIFYIYQNELREYELLISNEKGQEVFQSNTLIGCVVTIINFVVDKLSRAKMNIIFRNLI